MLNNNLTQRCQRSGKAFNERGSLATR